MLRLPQSGKANNDVEVTIGDINEVITTKFSPTEGLTYTQEPLSVGNITERIKFSMNKCADLRGTEKYTSCVVKAGYSDFEGLADRTNAAVSSVNLMTSRLRNYTCNDPDLKTSPPIYSTSVNASGNSYSVDVLLNSDNAKIWTIDNLVTDDECQTLMDHARAKLERATVSGEDGLSVVSESRKAQQARYSPQLNNTNAESLTLLFDRLYTITNSITGLNMHPDGQEGFMVIQYGKNDQYTPHCDGLCDGTKYRKGGRVATAILYCKVADVGGGTTFTQSDIFLKPSKGMVTFFSYKGPDGTMDDGLTRHSGCPVLEGEKWITTAWMREGVSLEEPNELFDPVGNVYAEIERAQALEKKYSDAEKVTETDGVEGDVTAADGSEKTVEIEEVV
jgi:hypothetical protein